MNVDAPAMGVSLGSWRTIWTVMTAVGIAALVFVAVGSLVFPQGPDQAMWAWVGSVVLRGGAPYSAAWDIKGPLTHCIYALSILLFGRGEIAIRILDLATVVVCCLSLRRLVFRLNGGDVWGANWAVLLFGLMYYAGGYADTAQAEEWGGMLILWAVWLLLEAPERPYRNLVGAGLLIALAALIKPTFLIYLTLPVVWGQWGETPRSEWMKATCLSWISCGVVVGVAILVLFLVGALGDYFDILRYIYTTYEPLDRPSLLAGFLALPETLFRFGLLVPYLLVPIGLLTVFRLHRNRVTVLLGGWFFLAMTTVIVQRRFWQDHWLPAAMAAAAIFGIALTYLTRSRIVQGRHGFIGHVLVCGLALAGVFPSAQRAIGSNYSWPEYLLGAQSREDYIEKVTRPFNEVALPFNYFEQLQVARYITQHTREDETFAIWGWDVSVYVMAQRRSATRFSVYQALDEQGPVLKKYQNAFLSELSKNHPKYIVIDTRGTWYLPPGSGQRSLENFSDFKEWLIQHYRVETVLGVYQFWVSKSN